MEICGSTKLCIKISFVKDSQDNVYIQDNFANLSFLDDKKKIATKIKHFNETIDLAKEDLADLFQNKLFSKPVVERVRTFKNPSLMCLLNV